MKLLSIFLSAAFVVVINGQTDCDYNYVCDDSGSPGDLNLDAPSALACYKACKASVDVNGDPDCLFWTYYEELGFGRSFDEENDTELDNVDGKLRASGKPVCRRLTSCETTFDISACGSTVGGAKCASGPGSCEPCDICPPLSYDGSSAAVAHWTCDADLPYSKTAGLPELSTCYLTCPSPTWQNGNFAEASCVSACATDPSAAAGTWTLSVGTAGVTDADGNAPTPSEDPACLCEDLPLGANQLPGDDGTTAEAGASFFCSSPLVDTGSGKADTMDSTSKCKLFCNGHVTMDIKCIAGSWTAGVQTSEDIYCWGPPLDCDYNPGVNSDVCTCNDDNANPTLTNICAAGEGCNAGNCVAACQPGTPAAADCFCETLLGGSTCAVGQTCDAGACV